jgi:hypothetical protein
LVEVVQIGDGVGFLPRLFVFQQSLLLTEHVLLVLSGN